MPVLSTYRVATFFININCAGLMCELLWSDPHPGTGRAPSKRGVGVAFGSDVTHRFLEDNNLGMPWSLFRVFFGCSFTELS